MCGRFVSIRSPQDLASVFDVTCWDSDGALDPSWNVAPTDDVWSVLERVECETGEITRQLRALCWGLVPSWAKSLNTGAKMINARAETVAEKPAYRRAFAKRRCLLPADGFYEWQNVAATKTAKARKQPYFISPDDGQVMALAGLYEFWRDPAVEDDGAVGAWWATCTIITTEASMPPAASIPVCRLRSLPPTGVPGSTPPTRTPTSYARCWQPPPPATSAPAPYRQPSTTCVTTALTSSTSRTMTPATPEPHHISQAA
ncbi:SOS response associated peptidase (SRAP) [Streptomyces sp. 2323.1]|nr:SOS response associated peptidase (SRAP) [Streptomyces sp. 2323.1]SOE16246.1 SOS response associated peptidase (SRAP) [Streptomyces sp. 2323.1]